MLSCPAGILRETVPGGKGLELRQSRGQEEGREGCHLTSSGWRAPCSQKAQGPHLCSLGSGVAVIGGV